MHWGHATSLDLAHWQEEVIALYPDDLGTCFSGSAIETATGEVKLFYTAHRLDQHGADHQTQCLVHVDRDFTTFRREPRNPIIDNPGLPAFRDPKVIWHEPTQRWTMVVTHGQAIGFYTSADLVTWRFESTFGEDEGRHSEGPWECPDLFPLTDPAGDVFWVLTVGIGSGAYAEGSGTQYFVGRFDGVRFLNANPADTTLWLDYGRDFYAAQTFFGGLPEAPIALGWMNNWAYARATPTSAFRGSLSLPRQLRLVQDGESTRLAARVPGEVRAAFPSFEFSVGIVAPYNAVYLLEGDIVLCAGEATSVALFGEASPQIVFERSTSGSIVLRLCREPREGLGGFAHRYDVPLGAAENVHVELYVDHGSVEMVLADGLFWVTNLYFPSKPSGEVTVRRQTSDQ
jgi:fructan beta-fructosidase